MGKADLQDRYPDIVQKSKLQNGGAEHEFIKPSMATGHFGTISLLRGARRGCGERLELIYVAIISRHLARLRPSTAEMLPKDGG